jgi:hypothetical protein
MRLVGQRGRGLVGSRIGLVALVSVVLLAVVDAAPARLAVLAPRRQRRKTIITP